LQPSSPVFVGQRFGLKSGYGVVMIKQDSLYLLDAKNKVLVMPCRF
jgi:hypothetical protein